MAKTKTGVRLPSTYLGKGLGSSPSSSTSVHSGRITKQTGLGIGKVLPATSSASSGIPSFGLGIGKKVRPDREGLSDMLAYMAAEQPDDGKVDPDPACTVRLCPACCLLFACCLLLAACCHCLPALLTLPVVAGGQLHRPLGVPPDLPGE